MREYCLFWLWRNGRTMGSDNWFSVCLWQSLNNLSGQFSNTQRRRMTIENPNLDGQVHTLFSENKTMSKLHCQRRKCFPVYWNCLMKLFACKLNCLKQSLIRCHFHSTQITTEEFLYPTHCLLKVCFEGMCIWDTVMTELCMEISNNDSWSMDIKKRKIWAKFYRI